MEKYIGEIASKGIAQGEIYWYQKNKIEVTKEKTTNVEEELNKYRNSFYVIEEDLKQLYQKAKNALDVKTANIFSAFLVLLQDEIFQQAIENKIKIEKSNAAYAIQTVCQEFADHFFKLDDVYMRERGNDILHVSHRLLSVIKVEQVESVNLIEPVILVAKDLSPSEIFQLNYEMVKGIVLLEGSIYSHTTVIIEMMNIPMLVNVKGLIGENIKNQYGVVHAGRGEFYMNPDSATLEEIKKEQENYAKKNEKLKQCIGEDTITLDGKKIKLFANISCLKDLQQAVANDAEGIGLLRSEGLFMQEKNEPLEETQFLFYKQVVEQMQGKEVIIRTLDVGADKKIPYLHMEEEKNPAIGVRGIRYSFFHPEIIKTQLKAILRAAAYGTVSVLYPMITTLEEVKKVLQLMEIAKNELAAQQVPFGEVLQGIMIETPAAAICSDVLAKEVDFFSIGTNDLTQHTLACDRQNMQLKELFQAKNPAVIKLINLSIKNAHSAGIPIGICGDLGGDLNFMNELLNMRLDSLSVVPSKILELRDTIRNLNLSKEKETKNENNGI